MDLMLSKCICFFTLRTFLLCAAVSAPGLYLVYFPLAAVPLSLEFGYIFLNEINGHYPEEVRHQS